MDVPVFDQEKFTDCFPANMNDYRMQVKSIQEKLEGFEFSEALKGLKELGDRLDKLNTQFEMRNAIQGVLESANAALTAWSAGQYREAHTAMMDAQRTASFTLAKMSKFMWY